MTIHGLILAAGSGQRFGSNKMLVKIDGRYPWQIVRDAMMGSVDSLIVVGFEVRGGDTRRQSILAGLAQLPESADRVIIAEGARFLATKKHFEVMSRAEGDAIAFGSLLVNSVYDMHIDRPIPRHNSWNIHTPQAFDLSFLKGVLDKHNESWVSDEWSLARMHYPKRCRIIDGDWRTEHKLTWPNDFEVMRALYYAVHS